MTFAKEKGINFILNNSLKSIETIDKKVDKITFNSGKDLKTDYMLLFSNNYEANTKYLKNSKLDNIRFNELDNDNNTPDPNVRKYVVIVLASSKYDNELTKRSDPINAPKFKWNITLALQ